MHPKPTPILLAGQIFCPTVWKCTWIAPLVEISHKCQTTDALTAYFIHLVPIVGDLAIDWPVGFPLFICVFQRRFQGHERSSKHHYQVWLER
jgi:hypothetical protein